MKFDTKHFNLKILQNLSYKEQEELAKEVREEILSDVSLNGGHLSSNLGAVELTIALLHEFDPYKDDILFDVGHQTYAYKILTGRDLSSLRQKNGVSGFQKIGESGADRFESGHSGTSIPTALGISAAKKLSGDTSATVVVIGDSSLANGLSLEGLNSFREKNFGKLIILVNDNNMSISKPKGALSHFLNKVRTSAGYQEGAGKFKKAFDHNGLRWIYRSLRHVKDTVKRIFLGENFLSAFSGAAYLGPIDGHNIKKLEQFLKRAKEIDRTVILHVKTKKGKGYVPAEEDDSGYWHGTSPFDVESGLPKDLHPDTVSFSHIAGDAVYERLEKDKKAVVLTPAMICGSHLERCFRAFPKRCIDCGIAEEEAVSICAGLALKGYHPILCIYSTFMQRAYDELLIDLCRMKLNVLILIDRVGLIGRDGSSHQGIFDPSMILSFPNASLDQPLFGEEIREEIASASFCWGGPHFVRLERTYEKKETKIDVPLNRLVPNKGKALIFLGQRRLKDHSLYEGEYDLVYLSKIRPFPEELLKGLMNEKEISVVDDTSVESGTAGYIKDFLNKNGYKGTVKTYSLDESFYTHGSVDEQLLSTKMDQMNLYSRIHSKE